MTTNTADFRRSNNQPRYQRMPRREYEQRAHEFAARGESHPRAKLSTPVVLQIRADIDMGRKLETEMRATSIVRIAEKLGIGERVARRYIRTGHKGRTMDVEDCRLADAMHAEHLAIRNTRAQYTYAEIARRYGISKRTVDAIATHERWGHVNADKSPEYLAGQQACISGKSEESCPYMLGEIRERCAWLAGFWDMRGAFK